MQQSPGCDQILLMIWTFVAEPGLSTDAVLNARWSLSIRRR